ncbi:MAG: beta-hexosaminidase [Gammaproteobacteria bacterium BRH_c0]|nr:MAG: beta-hexosaminidase [Gammaproteobacteria bacterium BRH_c0]
MKAGPLMLDLEGLSLSDEDKDLLRHPMVGGVIFFARNFHSRQQIESLSADIAAIRPELLIAVDQEGGRVQRFREGFTRLPPMQALGDYFAASPEDGTRLLHDCGWLMAAEVLAAGVDFSFAPVLDVDRDGCAVIANRSFSDDPVAATAAARHFIAGMHEAGMAATGKHFPGHGGVAADSHLETPFDKRALEELTGRDLVPFRELAATLDAVMPGHIVFPAVDEHCVGFSRHWLQDILRTQLGFNGVIFSDDLSMKGADHAGGYARKTELALAAGCDMVLVCNDRPGAIEVLDFLSRLKLEPSARLATMKARKGWRWPQLDNDERRLRVIGQLEALA